MTDYRSEINEMFTFIDEAGEAGDIGKIDMLLDEIDWENSPKVYVLSMIRYTFPYRNELHRWFVHRDRLDLRPDITDNMLHGLLDTSWAD